MRKFGRSKIIHRSWLDLKFKPPIGASELDLCFSVHLPEVFHDSSKTVQYFSVNRLILQVN